ncbi:MAG: hypothetical protein R3315_01005 [Woeseiaceae bacterium]|nr:hypothetical protein [Woeseiaceae bacterium]
MPKSASIQFEILLLTTSLAFGLTLLPALVYAVGLGFFGGYADGGLGAFFADFHRELWSFSLVVWFLVFSPYLVLQTLRWTIRIFRTLRAR